MRKFLLLFVFLFSQHSHSAANNLNVGWELWFPYQYRDNTQKLVGLDLDVFKALLARTGLTANYLELPWKRHLMFIESGEMDVAFGSSYTKERETYAYFTEPYRLEKVALFIRKGRDIKLNTLSDIVKNNYILGIESGYYYGEKFATLLQNIDFKNHTHEVLDIEQNISMLLKDRIHALLADPVTIKAFSKKYRIEDELDQYPLDIYQANIYLMLSKKTLTEEHLKKFNKAIAAMKKDGSLNTILMSWQSGL